LCGPTVPWDWFVIDVSYVLVLVGGGMIFRARQPGVFTWIGFAFLSTLIGAFLLFLTYDAQAAFAAGASDANSIFASARECGAAPSPNP
jgi:hypothetical protein